MIGTEKGNTLENRSLIWIVGLFVLTLLLWILPQQTRAEEETQESEITVSLYGEDANGGRISHETVLVTGDTLSGTTYGSSRSTVGAYYGDSKVLSQNEYAIYQKLAEVSEADQMSSYSDSGNLGIEVSLPDPYSGTGNYYDCFDSLQEEFAKGTDAFIFDYSEEYWIGGFSCNVKLSASGSSYKITALIIYPVDYYSGIRNEMEATTAALQSLSNSVSGDTTYELVKNAHDAVINLITYPSNTSPEYYHTITGALLSKYNHEAVCDGYARLFRLICQAKKISCILVPGGSSYYSDGTVVADHIWNMVKMDDGNWYLVDCTWDDSSSEDHYQYFLIGSDNAGADCHIPVGVFSTGSTYGEFSMPTLASADYERPTEEQTASEVSVTLSKYSLTLTCGQKGTLLTATPQPTSAVGLNWSSTDTEVVKVDSSTGYTIPRITAVKAGTATLQLADSSGKVLASCIVTVNHQSAVKTVAATTSKEGYKLTYCSGCGAEISRTILPKYQVKLNVTSLPLQVKKSTTALKIASYTSGDSVSSWKSSNSKIVKVNSKTGKLTAKKKGTATITVTMKSGAKATCRVTVQKGTVKTKKLTVTPSAVTLQKGKTQTLKVVKTPLTSTQKITFKSSNKKVATVNSKGKITAKKKGTAYITIKSGSKKVKIKVTVQ